MGNTFEESGSFYSTYGWHPRAVAEGGNPVTERIYGAGRRGANRSTELLETLSRIGRE